MNRKDANIFPFYNLLPEPKKTSQRFLLCFLTFPQDKIKSQLRLLLNRNKRKTIVSSPTVSQNWRLCWGEFLKWSNLRAQITFACLSFLCFLTFPWDKIKSQWRLLLNRNICECKRKTSSQFSHCITELATLLENNLKVGLPQGFRSPLHAYIA